MPSRAFTSRRFEATFSYRASFGARPMTGGDDRWNLPRYVCGRDWSSPDGLEALLADVGAARR